MWLMCPNHFRGHNYFKIEWKIKNENDGKCDSCICLCCDKMLFILLPSIGFIQTHNDSTGYWPNIFTDTIRSEQLFWMRWWVVGVLHYIICPIDLAALPRLPHRAFSSFRSTECCFTAWPVRRSLSLESWSWESVPKASLCMKL